MFQKIKNWWTKTQCKIGFHHFGKEQVTHSMFFRGKMCTGSTWFRECTREGCDGYTVTDSLR